MAVPSPTVPPTSPPPDPIRRIDDPLRDYQRVAETVGGPSLRARDNLIQAGVVLVCTASGAVTGYLAAGTAGALGGGIGMMILSTLVSGLVLMVLGWVRVSKGK